MLITNIFDIEKSGSNFLLIIIIIIIIIINNPAAKELGHLSTLFRPPV
jgi:hypothetical protein